MQEVRPWRHPPPLTPESRSPPTAFWRESEWRLIFLNPGLSGVPYAQPRSPGSSECFVVIVASSAPRYGSRTGAGFMTPTFRLGARFICAWALLVSLRADAVATTNHSGERSHDLTAVSRHQDRRRVRLSGTKPANVLHRAHRVLHVAAVDLNGDGRPEFIVSTHSALHVWDRTTRQLRTYRISRRPDVHRRLSYAGRRGSKVDGSGAELNPYEDSPVPPLLQSHPSYEPPAHPDQSAALHPIRGPTSRSSFQPSAPRPPPGFPV